MIRLFEGVSHAQAYALARPKTPKTVAEKTIEYMKQRNPLPKNGLYDCMIDVGCGSGQSTAIFSSYFTKLLGLDPSQKQIEEAQKGNKASNVTYQVGQAEELEGEHNVDLVASGQAVHWVDFQSFFKQCQKVLKPNGCLLLHGYDRPRIFPKFSQDPALATVAEELFSDFYSKCLFHPRRKHVDDHYETIFGMIQSNHKIRDKSIQNKVESTLADFIQYLKTWSGYQAYMKKLSETGNLSDSGDILEEFISNLKQEWNIPEKDLYVPIIISWDIFIILSERPHVL